MTNFKEIPFAFIAPYPGGAELSPELDRFIGEPCLACVAQSPNWVSEMQIDASYWLDAVDTSEGPVFMFVWRRAHSFLYVLADALDERLWTLFAQWEGRGSYVSHVGLSGAAHIHEYQISDMSAFVNLRAAAGRPDENQFRKAVDEILHQNFFRTYAAELLSSYGEAHAIEEIMVEANVLDFNIDGAALVDKRA
jgi:hypothetical protein